MRPRRVGSGLVLVLSWGVLSGCARAEASCDAPGCGKPAVQRAPELTTADAEPPRAVAEPLRLERVRVPGDLPVVVVNGTTAEPPAMVFLPGICSNVLGYVQAIEGAAHAHGGIVGLDGDAPCGDSKVFRSFSWDANKLHARIEAALAAAGRHVVPREGLVLVGYSQGAALGEQLAARWPARYSRVVLIGAPSDPSAASFARVRAVATMSCQRDVPWKMKEATQRLVKAKVPSAYFEMPGCTHGMMADGERVFEETFGWLEANAKAATGTEMAITGVMDGDR